MEISFTLNRKHKVTITRARIGPTHLTHSFRVTKESAATYDTCKKTLKSTTLLWSNVLNTPKHEKSCCISISFKGESIVL